MSTHRVNEVNEVFPTCYFVCFWSSGQDSHASFYLYVKAFFTLQLISSTIGKNLVNLVNLVESKKHALATTEMRTNCAQVCSATLCHKANVAPLESGCSR